MQLKFTTLKDFASVWKSAFLGHQGLFLPGQQKLKIGQLLDAEVIVEGENWGKVQLVVVWMNQHGLNSELTPKGLFLRLLTSGPDFQRKVAGL